MLKRFVPAAMAATGLIASMMVGAPSASAEGTCTISAYTPGSVVMGTTYPVEKTFSVTAACDPLVWDITLFTGGWVYLLDKVDPTDTFDPHDFQNSDAGVKGAAYIRAYDQSGAKDTATLGFYLKRATKWTTFNASPEPVTKGQPIKITGALKVADWNTHAYVPQKGSSVSVQFMAAGTTTWSTVKTVTTSSTYGTVSTTVTASVDGTWRLRYGGSGSRGGSISATDYVDVR